MSGGIRVGARKPFGALRAHLRRLGILVIVFLIGAFGKCATADEILANGVTPPSIATSLPYNGDPTGLRALMASYGATFNFIYTNDELGNVNGGLRRGFINQGKLEYNMTVDLQKLIGWQGLSLGRIRRDYVGGINTIAAIEACRRDVCLNYGWSRVFGMAARAFAPVNSRPTSSSSTLMLRSCSCRPTGQRLPRRLFQAAGRLIRSRRRAHV